MLFILEDNEERIEYFQKVLGTREHHIEKTVKESIEWLQLNREKVELYSLDNDLYVPEYPDDAGEGWQLCEWLLEHCPKKPIIIHTTNSYAGTKMEMDCEEKDWPSYRIVPFNGMEWILSAWANRVHTLWKTSP